MLKMSVDFGWSRGGGGSVVSGREAGEAAGLRGRARAWLASSAWTSLLGKGAAYLAGFAALAYVGSGGLSGIFPLSGVASASSAAAASASASSASSAAVASASASGASSAAPVQASAAASSGGAPASSAASDAGAPPATGGAITPDGKVILNLAGEEDLRRLPGIGPSKAKAIIDLRGKLKKFRRVEDLLRVKGIGRKKLARLRPLLLIDPP